MSSASASASAPAKPTTPVDNKDTKTDEKTHLAGSKRGLQEILDLAEACGRVLEDNPLRYIGRTHWCEECEGGDDSDGDEDARASRLADRKYGDSLGERAEQLMDGALSARDSCLRFRHGVAFAVTRLKAVDNLVGGNYTEDKRPTADGLFSVDGKPFLATAQSCQALLDSKQASPSAFGDLLSATTKLDAAVRHAFEVPAERIELSTPLRAFLMCDVQESAALRALFGVSVRAKLYKLNVYPVGGHFRPHQDTPREGTIGTLLLEFSVPGLTGGELQFPLASGGCISPPKTGQVTGIAFYGNVTHAVSPVTAGFRVSLAFHVTPLEWDATPGPDILKAVATQDIGEIRQYCNSLIEYPACDALVLTSKRCVTLRGGWEPCHDAGVKEANSASAPSAVPNDTASSDDDDVAISKSPLLDRYLTAVDATRFVATMRAAFDATPRAVLGMIMDSRYALTELNAVKAGMAKRVDGPSLHLLRMIPGTRVFFLPIKLHTSHTKDDGVLSSTHCVEYCVSKRHDEHADILEFIGHRVVFGRFADLVSIQRIHHEGADFTGNESRPEQIENLYLATACVVVDAVALDAFLASRADVGPSAVEATTKKQKL